MKYLFEIFFTTPIQQQNLLQKYPLKFIFIFSIITLIIIFNYDPLQNQNTKLIKQLKEYNKKRLIYFENWLEPLNLNIKKIPEFEQFILSEKMFGQLGNQVMK